MKLSYEIFGFSLNRPFGPFCLYVFWVICHKPVDIEIQGTITKVFPENLGILLSGMGQMQGDFWNLNQSIGKKTQKLAIGKV